MFDFFFERKLTLPLVATLRGSSVGRRLRSVAKRLRPQMYRLGRFVAPQPSRSLARARWAAGTGQWQVAIEAWDSAIARADRVRPVWFYELARAWSNIGDVQQSTEQRRRALILATADASGIRDLARTASADEEWTYAAEAYVAAARMDGDIESLVRGAQAYFRDGLMLESARLFEQVLNERSDAPAEVFAGLTNAQRKLGDLVRAEEVAREGLALHPTSAAIAGAHGWIASDRRDWSAAANRWPLAFGVRLRETPPRWIFRYGEALEKLERYRDAIDMYDLALLRLGSIDQPWAHWAILEWEFRRAYCSQRLSPSDAAAPPLTVQVDPADNGAAAAQGSGRFSADITHLGLRLRGIVDEPVGPSVEVHLNGHRIKLVDLDHAGSRSEFAFTVRHSALARFPPSSRVSILVSGRFLTADTGGEEIAVTVPHGDTTLLDRLSTSEVFTKKGALVPFGADDLSSERLLASYTTVRQLFAERFDIDLFLLYGSLLGCHRDGRFIPGDDDLDVGYLTGCTDPEQLKRETVAIVQAVIDAGFDVTTRHGGGLFKILLGEVEIDVYPIWFNGGRAWGYDAVVAKPEDYEPAETRDLLGVEVLVPAHPEVLLAGTYGHGWKEPNPGFRHYRSKRVMNMLQRTCLTPLEAKQMLEENGRRRAAQPAIGSFEMHNGGAL